MGSDVRSVQGHPVTSTQDAGSLTGHPITGSSLMGSSIMGSNIDSVQVPPFVPLCMSAIKLFRSYPRCCTIPLSSH